MNSIQENPSQTNPQKSEGYLVHQATALYVFVDDFLQAHPRLGGWRSSNHASPAFTDAEVVTVALLQGCLGCATLKKTHQLVADVLADAFPRLCSYPQFVHRLHALTALVGRLIQAALSADGSPFADWPFYLMDAKPIPLCKAIRHGRVRLLREDGAFFGKGSTGWFFGFKLHALVHISGQIVCAVLTPGNWPERDVAQALAHGVEGGVALADLGYRSRDGQLAQTLYEDEGLLLLTPADAGGKRAPCRLLLSSVRERVETTFSSLWARFVDRVQSRSWTGLWNTVKLKMLHFNLCLAGIIQP